MPTPIGYLTTSVRLAVNLSLQQHEFDSELRNEKKLGRPLRVPPTFGGSQTQPSPFPPPFHVKGF